MGSLIKWGNRHLFSTAILSGTTVLALILLAGIVFAHDERHETDWIGEDRLANGDGVLCCGDKDCTEIPEGDRKNMSDGVHIHVRAREIKSECGSMGYCTTGERAEEWDEVWAYKDLVPNPRNGKTYRCAWPKQRDRKCLIHGQPGS